MNRARRPGQIDMTPALRALAVGLALAAFAAQMLRGVGALS